jgi:hypothetical protein
MATQAFVMTRQPLLARPAPAPRPMPRPAARVSPLASYSARRPFALGPHDAELRVPDLPSLPSYDDINWSRRRKATWERRYEKVQAGTTEQAKAAIALAIGGLLGTALGTTLCLTLLG